MANVIKSYNGVQIRLTDERWSHITEEHSELAGMRYDVLEVIAQPSRVLKGSSGELLAVREIDSGKFLVVVFKQNDDDGFVITAFMTRRASSLVRRELVWSEPS